MWVCSPDVTPLILDHYNKVFDLPGVSKGARASVVGKIRNDGQYIVYNGDEEIVNAKAKEVTEGFLYNRPYEARKQNFSEPNIIEPLNYNKVLLKILSHENMASREPIFEQYDKQIQGRIHTETGLADSGVMAPFNSEKYPEEIRNVGIALSTDHNPRYGLIDPYWGGVNAVVEAMRNVAAVGATPHALSDCLCFGNPEKPHQMWEFVESVRGVADACHSITLKDNPEHATPIIAGNVSFYNESKNGAIPPSPIVSCLGRLKDVNKTVPAHFQKSDSAILMIGERKDELGGSVYYNLFNELGANIPKPNFEEVKNQIFALTDCIDDGLVLSCHDIADGGIASAIAEMTFGNAIGCQVKIESDLNTAKCLFSETGGFVLEVSSGNLHEIKSVFLKHGLDIFEVGKTGGSHIKINNALNLSMNKVNKAWKNGLREKL
jgi:phosphoribosylformylglycinamidine synthase